MSEKNSSEPELIIDKKTGKKMFKAALKLYRIHDYEGALNYLEEAIKANPIHYDFRNQKGVILDKMERFEEAIKAYDEAIKINPEEIQAYYNKGLALKDLKRYEEAIEAFNQVNDIDITKLSAHFEKGKIYEELGNYPEAIKRYEVILEFSPRAEAVVRRLNKALEKYAEITNVWKDKIKSD